MTKLQTKCVCMVDGLCQMHGSLLCAIWTFAVEGYESQNLDENHAVSFNFGFYTGDDGIVQSVGELTWPHPARVVAQTEIARSVGMFGSYYADGLHEQP